MTHVESGRLKPRECRLYRFWVEHPTTGRRVLGYIGETGRVPFERLLEHVYAQPWADTIIAWEVDPAVYTGKAAVVAAEQAAVEVERPLYNHEFNLANPLRVEIWRAKEQRWDRDTQAGRPRWTPAVRGRFAGRAALEGSRPVSATRSWTPLQVKASLWSTAWALLTVVWWGLLDRHGPWSTSTNALNACLASAALLVWAVWRTPDTRKMWARRLRRLRRWVR